MIEILGKGAPDLRSELFGGQGTVKVWNLMRQAAPPFTAVLACELEPGGRVGRHRQEHYPEIVIGISGLGEAIVGKQQHGLRPGDMVYLPQGEILELINHRDDEPLQYLIIKAREGG
ncbi:cupin domain-containing protein [Pseudenhygromyxa sp. WMMC2535]|uniref:cupin domain-containing protein n=1 Tax=Pseudenhygromyxa sp. WMMC2535 TaxID=2712867 RepID=UPI001556A84B|nr:cupin domain-containing protein [Pseudenhygromyxa sp. WMMC2535]NVB37382.1 cupin domain-containing protein [Pseudenhygromyxa sp. WMMC2535]